MEGQRKESVNFKIKQQKEYNLNNTRKIDWKIKKKKKPESQGAVEL